MLCRKRRETMNKGFSIVEKNSIKLISVDCINDTGIFNAYYSTGFGGVSDLPGGCSMNLNIFKRTIDCKENSIKNFDLFCDAIKVPNGYNNLVAQHEVHSSIVRKVTKKDCKKDIFDVTQYADGDGQITDDSIPLFVYASDCATIMIADPVTGIYGTTHCGWKNSLNNTINNWIGLFKQLGGNVKTAIAAIGPSLCQDCFEVDDDVRNLFLDSNPSFVKYMFKKGSKTHIDLNGINSELLVEEGIEPDNIHISGICNRTEYNLPSYRRDKGANGVMGGIIFKKN